MTELIDPTVKIATPSGVYEDMQKFVDRMKNETVDVKQLGLVGRTKEQILQEINARTEFIQFRFLQKMKLEINCLRF